MQKHARSMVLASFTADSFALGAHWIYDTNKIDQQFGQITTLLAPQEGSYHPTKKLGDLTHYGDQSFHLLGYLAAHGGNFNSNEYSRAWQSFVADYQGYKDHAMKKTLQNLADGRGPDSCGSDSTDLGGPAQIAPLIYCYRENLDALLEAVTAFTSLTHCGPGVIGGALFLARSCFSILHGATPGEAFRQAINQSTESPELDLRLQKCLVPAGIDTRQQIKEFGQMCAIKAALPGAVYTVLQNEDNLEEAFIETVMAGGDSAARGMVVGMILGAYHGLDKIPSRWLEKLTGYEQIRTALDTLP